MSSSHARIDSMCQCQFHCRSCVVVDGMLLSMPEVVMVGDFLVSGKGGLQLVGMSGFVLDGLGHWKKKGLAEVDGRKLDSVDSMEVLAH